MKKKNINKETNEELLEIKGKVEKIFFTGNNNWCCFLLRTDTNSVKVVGNIPKLEVDKNLKIKGLYTENKYGKNFEISSYEVIIPESKKGIIKYLSSGDFKGIGKKIAERIVEHFGVERTLEVLEKNPDRLNEVKGLSEKKINIIKNGIFLNKQVFELQILTNGNLSYNQVTKIIEEYKEKASSVIKNNPYRLIYDIDGIGFAKADAIASSLGINKHALSRIEEGIIYSLKIISEGEGHVFAYKKDLMKNTISILFPPKIALAKQKIVFKEYKTEYARKLAYEKAKFTQQDMKEVNDFMGSLPLYKELIEQALINNEDKEKIKIIIDSDNKAKIYWTKLYTAENETAKTLATLSKQKPIRIITNLDYKIREFEDKKSDELGIEFRLEEEQKEAVKNALTHRVSVITGGAGVGKTTIVECIMFVWGNEDKICLSAPTGKASQRMTEATGKKATTIHLRLALQEVHKGELAIIDESTMMDIKTASLALSLFKDNCQIIFLGDVNQLPSVGAGSFFQDICNSPYIYTSRLEKGHRNQGNIALNANRINNGEKVNTFTYGNDFKIITTEKENIISVIKDIYTQFLSNNYKPKDIIILCPQKKQGKSCVNICNERIRDIANPGGKMIPGSSFNIGDKVICTKNNHYKEGTLNGEEIKGIFNGDCGTIIEYNEDDNEIIFLTDDMRQYTYSISEMEDFELCYAMTIHKSQGSEYPVVIMPFTTESYMLLKRNILYTGITRSKKNVFLITEPKAIAVNMAISNTEYNKRNSSLKEKIEDYYLFG